MIIRTGNEEPIEDRAKVRGVHEVHARSIPQSHDVAVYKLEEVVSIYLRRKCSRVNLTGSLCGQKLILEPVRGSDEEADDRTVWRRDADDSDPFVALCYLVGKPTEKFVETTIRRLARFVETNGRGCDRTVYVSHIANCRFRDRPTSRASLRALHLRSRREAASMRTSASCG